MPGDIKAKVIDQYKERWKIAGTKRVEPSTAVTITEYITYEEGKETIETELKTYTQHIYETSDGLKWIVSPELVEYHKDGFC